MGTPAEDEERERIRKAHENVQKWQEQYVGAGFSGGYRIVTQTNRGIVSDTGQRAVGNPAMAKKIVDSGPGASLSPSKPLTPQPPPAAPPVVQVKKPPFLKWLIGLFSREKKS